MVLVTASNRQTEARGPSTPQTRYRVTPRYASGCRVPTGARPPLRRGRRERSAGHVRECGTRGPYPEAFCEKKVSLDRGSTARLHPPAITESGSARGDGLREAGPLGGRGVGTARAAPADRPGDRVPERERRAE